jgi:hypothetical protein
MVMHISLLSSSLVACHFTSPSSLSLLYGFQGVQSRDCQGCKQHTKLEISQYSMRVHCLMVAGEEWLLLHTIRDFLILHES